MGPQPLPSDCERRCARREGAPGPRSGFVMQGSRTGQLARPRSSMHCRHGQAAHAGCVWSCRMIDCCGRGIRASSPGASAGITSSTAACAQQAMPPICPAPCGPPAGPSSATIRRAAAEAAATPRRQWLPCASDWMTSSRGVGRASRRRSWGFEHGWGRSGALRRRWAHARSAGPPTRIDKTVNINCDISCRLLLNVSPVQLSRTKVPIISAPSRRSPVLQPLR